MAKIRASNNKRSFSWRAAALLASTDCKKATLVKYTFLNLRKLKRCTAMGTAIKNSPYKKFGNKKPIATKDRKNGLLWR